MSKTAAVDNTSLADLHNQAQIAWTQSNHNVYIAPREKMAIHDLEMRCMQPWDSGDTRPCVTSADFVPVVSIPGLPANRYPEYAHALIGPTIACMRIEHPELTVALCTSSMVKAVTVVVAARAGFWAATNWTPAPAASLPKNALFYDNKRRNLWLARAREDHAHDKWLAAHGVSFDRMRYQEEVIGNVAAVSPALAVTGAVSLTQSGPAFMTSLMDGVVAKVLQARLSEGASTELSPKARLVLDCIRFGALAGAPQSAVRRWATDPLAAVCAQRRVAMTMEDVASLKQQEMELASSASTPGVVTDDDETEGFTDPLMRRIAHRPAELGPVEPTVLDGDDEESRPGTPRQAVAAPSVDEHTEMGMGSEAAAEIREVARLAQQSAPQAPSMLAGADPDEPVKW